MGNEREAKRFVPTPLKDKDAKEMLWRLYQDNYVNARHHESQRATVTNFIILIAGGIGTIVSAGGFTYEDLPLTLLLICLGIFGALFSSSHYERYKRSKERAKAYLRELDSILFESDGKVFKSIKVATDVERKENHPTLDKLYDVHWLWMSLPLMVTVLGLTLTVLCLLDVGKPKATKVLLVDESEKPISTEQRK